jgi:hypothetical protein
MNTDNLFILDTEELTLIQSKCSVENHLAFAVMLKFFQCEGRYPTQADTISPVMINSLSAQLNCGHDIDFDYYDWISRTAKRFRQEIRILLDYKEASATDSKQFIQWVIEKILPSVPTLIQCREYARQFFRERHIEPFSQKKIDRYIRAAIHRFEKQFFSGISTQLSAKTIQLMDHLLYEDIDDTDENEIKINLPDTDIRFRHLKSDVAGVQLKHVNFEIKKLFHIRSISLPTSILNTVSRKLIQKYYMRVMVASPSNILEYIPEVRYASMALFCYIRSQLLTDNLLDLFIQLIQKMKTSAETHVNKKIICEVKRVNGKFDILYLLAETAKEYPEGIIQDKIYPKVSQEMLQDVIKDLQHRGKWYQKQVNTKVRSLYSHAHRKVLLTLLDAFTFHTNCSEGKALLTAIDFIKQHQEATNTYYPDSSSVPIAGIISSEWQSMVMEPHDVLPGINSESKIHYKVNRFNYEVAVLETLRSQLRCKSIWIEGAYRYRNPDEDLPQDWETRRGHYYQLLKLPLSAADFVQTLKESLHRHLQDFNDTILRNDKVKILDKNGGHIKLSPYEPQAESVYLDTLQREINRRWSTINLIDILKETDLRVGFTQQFHTVASRESLEKDQLRKRLLLCLYGIGSNTGLKRISTANADATHSDLRYVKRRYIQGANVKAAIVEIVNEILTIRNPKIWGEATTGCACDSTQVSSWDQNLMSQ